MDFDWLVSQVPKSVRSSPVSSSPIDASKACSQIHRPGGYFVIYHAMLPGTGTTGTYLLASTGPEE